MVENNRIFEPLYPLNVGIILSGVLEEVYGMTRYCYWSIIILPPPITKMRQWRQMYEVKTTPQINGSIEDNVRYVHIHIDQTVDLAVYN